MNVSLAGGRTLSTEQFRAAVRDAEPRIAVFDFDGTLWPGDAGSGFMRWSIDTGLLTPDAAQRLLARHAAYHRGEVDETTICGEMTQIYGGLRESAVRRSAEAYFRQHVRPSFFPEMVQLVQELHAAGVELWAVSSTNSWVIEEGVRELNIAPVRVLAACVVVENGTVSETLVAVPSDEGKAEALRRAGVPHPDAVFGNSVHDLAMLEMAGTAFPVNPSAALQEESVRRGWAVYHPGTRQL